MIDDVTIALQTSTADYGINWHSYLCQWEISSLSIKLSADYVISLKSSLVATCLTNVGMEEAVIFRSI